MDGDGAISVHVQNQTGQQIVVPHPHDLQHTHGDHRRLQHGQHHPEEGTHRAAAVDGGGLFNLQRQALDEARKHKHRQTCAEAQINHGDRPRGVQMQLVRRPGQRVHDHLERHHHGEYAQVVHDLTDQTSHTGDVPRRHRRTQQDQRRGGDGDEEAVEHHLIEGKVAEGHALDIVLQTHKGLRRGQLEGLGIDEGVCLQRVDEHQNHRHQIEHGDHGEQHRHKRLTAFSAAQSLGFHHCCTSLRRLA